MPLADPITYLTYSISEKGAKRSKITAPIITRVVMQAVPLIGFLTATILIKVLALHKKKIVKTFEVQPLPAQVRMELVYYYHAECRNSKLTSSW
ncbi:MAG: hypothetical protein M3114_06705 [Thermoproteota archaeon]|nr:hypothetical protein [Thermoproteota archaeon]MDQ4067259.1 hypothetical protein [Thermoproteota archaeon]